MKSIRISPSILAADFANLGADVAKAAKAGADYIHVDIMDGQFVPNISLGFPILKAIKPYCGRCRVDVHLMVCDPIRYIKTTADAGATVITVHYEACPDLQAVLDLIHACGKRAGVSIKPATPVEVLEPYLSSIDMILIMTVEPGHGGQAYMPESGDRIRKARQMADAVKPDIRIEVDGGINFRTVHHVLKAGADVIVAGTCIFRNYIEDNIKAFKGIFQFYENQV